MPKERPIIYAYETGEQTDVPLAPAPVTREWMEQTPNRFAYRCLPLAMANQAGWFIGNPVGFTARWNGGKETDDLAITLDEEDPRERIASHFGNGIITFRIPYLFRTPAGVNLWVKGPSNWIKDGVQALEGIVETDWATASFTMNWRMTRPDCDVRFEKEEPISMIVPTPRGLAESLDPRREPLAANPELEEEHMAWRKSRVEFIKVNYDENDSPEVHPWQKHYHRGRTVTGFEFDEHQVKLDLKPFERK